VIYWVDPRMTFAQSGRWNPVRQTSGRNGMLAEVDPAGVYGADLDMTLSRASDPVVPGRQAYRHRISNAFPTWSWNGWDTWRSEISANWSNDGTNVALGQEYWIAYAFKLDPDMVARGSGSNQILDFHSVPDQGDESFSSPFSLYAGEGGLSLMIRWDPNPVQRRSNLRTADLWFDPNPSTTQWHKLVMRVRFHWDNSRDPYIRIWRSVGDGPLTQIVNHSGPNAYNDTFCCLPQKFGLYRWDAWAGSATRTMFTKGFFVLRATAGSPALDERSMLARLNQI